MPKKNHKTVDSQSSQHRVCDSYRTFWWRGGLWCHFSILLTHLPLPLLTRSQCRRQQEAKGPPHPQEPFVTNSTTSVGNEAVTTMSNSGPYPVTLVASQLYSSTLVVHHLLRSWSRRYTSVKYDPWSSPYSVLTTPHHLPCFDVSSPCTCYIHHLVSFSPDLVYFTQTWLYFTRTWLSTFSSYPLSAF